MCTELFVTRTYIVAVSGIYILDVERYFSTDMKNKAYMFKIFYRTHVPSA